jgi:hypothetical protein
MKTTSEIHVEFHISKFQMLMLKLINCPRVFFGFDVWVPRFCVTQRIIIPVGDLGRLAKVAHPPRNP